jgi:hypothetical protein
MALWYTSSVAWTNVTAWAAVTSYSVGDIRRQLAAPTVGNERVWRCTTAGLSGGSEPTWTLTKGSTTNDGTAVWTEITGNSTYNWTAPHARLANALSWAAAGDTVYLSQDHAETQASAMTITGPGTAGSPVRVFCVNRSGSVPPVSADLRNTATISTTGANNLTVNGGLIFGSPAPSTSGGAIFQVGSGSNTALFVTGGNNRHFNNCSIVNNNTSTSSGIVLGAAGGGSSSYDRFYNTTVTFGSASQSIAIQNIRFEWFATASAVAGTAPTTLFSNISTRAATALISGVDLSAVTGTLVGAPSNTWLFIFEQCRLNSAVTASTASPNGRFSPRVELHNCDSGGTNYRQEWRDYPGNIVQSTSVVRTSGASDGTTPISWAFSSSAFATYDVQLFGPIVPIWNDTTGSSVTFYMRGIYNGAALPKNDEVWLEIEYPGNASYPLASFASNVKADILATGASQTADSTAWDTGATARANTTAYSVGNVIKLASNPGRLFFCTTAGTTAGSEPGGYASAVDGGSVTDNTAVFRAGMRFQLSVAVTPQLKGWIKAQVKVALASVTVHIDPLITLS